MEGEGNGVKIGKGTRFVPASKRSGAHKDGAHSSTEPQDPSIWSATKPSVSVPEFGQPQKPKTRNIPGQTPEPLGLETTESTPATSQPQKE